MPEGVKITREDATDLLVEIFKARDLPADEALLVAEGLVWADLYGIESHGLVRIPQYMLRVIPLKTNLPIYTSGFGPKSRSQSTEPLIT